MSAYLVSFHACVKSRMFYDSYVLELGQEPQTLQAIEEIEAILTMHFRLMDVRLENLTVEQCCYLPTNDDHPSDFSPYTYRLTYTMLDQHMNPGRGSTAYVRSEPIQTLNDVRSVEARIAARSDYALVKLVGCWALKRPPEQAAPNYDPAIYPDTHGPE